MVVQDPLGIDTNHGANSSQANSANDADARVLAFLEAANLSARAASLSAESETNNLSTPVNDAIADGLCAYEEIFEHYGVRESSQDPFFYKIAETYASFYALYRKLQALGEEGKAIQSIDQTDYDNLYYCLIPLIEEIGGYAQYQAALVASLYEREISFISKSFGVDFDYIAQKQVVLAKDLNRPDSEWTQKDEDLSMINEWYRSISAICKNNVKRVLSSLSQNRAIEQSEVKDVLRTISVICNWRRNQESVLCLVMESRDPQFRDVSPEDIVKGVADLFTGVDPLSDTNLLFHLLRIKIDNPKNFTQAVQTMGL